MNISLLSSRFSTPFNFFNSSIRIKETPPKDSRENTLVRFCLNYKLTWINDLEVWFKILKLWFSKNHCTWSIHYLRFHHVSFLSRTHHLFLQLWWARERREGGGVVLSKCYGGGLWRVVSFAGWERGRRVEASQG